jgi:hypothetical protein
LKFEPFLTSGITGTEVFVKVVGTFRTILLFFFQEKGRITKNGDFIITSDRTRKQILNQADCMDKIRGAIRQASIRPKEPSPEDIALKNKR